MIRQVRNELCGYYYNVRFDVVENYSQNDVQSVRKDCLS